MPDLRPQRRLGDLCRVIGGGTPSRKNPAFWGGALPWVSPKDMKRWEIHEAQESIAEAALDHSSAKLIPANSVLLVVRGMILRRAVPVALNRRAVAINQDMKALLPIDGVDAEYLGFMVRAQERELLARVETAGHGTGRLPTASWKSLEVPLPTFDEQRRIVARIRVAMERVDEVHQLREEAAAASEALLPSLLKELFDEVIAAEPDIHPLGSIIESTKYGTSQKCSTDIDGLPVLRIPNVGVGDLDVGKMKFLPWEDADLDKLALQRGDLLLVRTNGSPRLVGRCAVFDLEGTYGYASYLIRVRPNRDVMDSRFLSYFLASTGGRDQIAARRRTSAGQFNINSSNLKTILVPVPALAVQRSLINRMDEIRRAVALTLREHTESRRTEAALPAAILRKAFAGEL